jgi:hypothetical protein
VPLEDDGERLLQDPPPGAADHITDDQDVHGTECSPRASPMEVQYRRVSTALSGGQTGVRGPGDCTRPHGHLQRPRPWPDDGGLPLADVTPERVEFDTPAPTKTTKCRS